MKTLATIFATIVLCWCISYCAEAAKVEVAATTPTHNEDRSVLTDLRKIKITWGSCKSNTEFDTVQGSTTILTTQTGVIVKGFIYPTGMTKVCLVAYSINSKNESSRPTNMAVKNLLPAPGKPVTLGQPVIIQ